MGSNLEKVVKNVLSSVLFAFTKISPLRRYFYSNNFEGELCSILSSIVKGKSFKEQIKDFIEKTWDKLKDVKEDKIDSRWIINYLIEKINDELENEGKNDDIIKDIFYGKYEITMEDGRKKIKYMKKPLIFHIDLSKLNLNKYKTNELKQKFGEMIDVEKIIMEESSEVILEDNQELEQNKIIQIPEIIIMTFLNIKGNILYYNIKQPYNGLTYELIYSMEDKGDEDKKKSYFKENNFWYQFQSNDSSIKDIDLKDFLEKKENFKIVIYQKDNTLIQNFMKNKLLLSSEQKRILELMNEHIIPEHKYDNYYLLNKNLFYELKAFLDDPEKTEENKYKEANAISYRTSLLKVGEKGDENNLKYPINFVLIEEKIFKEFLENCGINPKAFDDIEKKIYQIKLGENHAFIKMDKDNVFFKKGKNEQEKILVCRYDEKNNIFEVEIVMRNIKKGGFDLDLEKYISNRGGMEYFYRLKKIDIEKHDLQEIRENGEKVGDLAIIIDVKSHINNLKYEMLKELEV